MATCIRDENIRRVVTSSGSNKQKDRVQLTPLQATSAFRKKRKKTFSHKADWDVHTHTNTHAHTHANTRKPAHTYMTRTHVLDKHAHTQDAHTHLAVENLHEQHVLTRVGGDICDLLHAVQEDGAVVLHVALHAQPQPQQLL